MNFYDKFPDFDWRFYLDVYPDLRNNGIKTEHQCKYHYVVHGYKEKRRTHDIIKKKKKYILYHLQILQIYIINQSLVLVFLCLRKEPLKNII